MHIGEPGNIDVGFTIARKRTRSEMLKALPKGSKEEQYFRSDPVFRSAFPKGDFNCWGVPPKALPRFRETRIGDVVLFFPRAGQNGALEYLGVVKAKCDFEAGEASKVLWPQTPHQKPFPFVFFFDTEAGNRYWPDFLDDVGYADNWDPRGYYRRIHEKHFATRGGPAGYLKFLRQQIGFRLI